LCVAAAGKAAMLFEVLRHLSVLMPRGAIERRLSRPYSMSLSQGLFDFIMPGAMKHNGPLALEAKPFRKIARNGAEVNVNGTWQRANDDKSYFRDFQT
jgi:hypothetical protein